MKRLALALVALAILGGPALAEEPKEKAKEPEKKEAEKTVVVGAKAPEFKIKDSQGKEINLADLTAKGPVLVRLTCGCSGCDKELAYFQEIAAEYKAEGLISLAVFREPDAKVETYVKEKKLNMLYAVDSDGKSWGVFQTKTMPTNILIAKGGKIISIAAGCDPSGLLANRVSEQVAETLKTTAVDVKKTVNEKKPEEKKGEK
ncbi:MAG: redoxin domain-containing protein [Planctomycetia bacterium]|nr:redoxin domain-containing protein [Planctomycetia bacterium]